MNVRDVDSALVRQVLDLPPMTVPSADEWDWWQRHAQLQRVVPLLYRLVTTSDIGLEHTKAPQQTRDLQADAMAWSVRLEHQLLILAECLQSVNIDFAVLKGLATAHLDYSDAALRQFGDIDLLVAPEARAEVTRLLVHAGWLQGYPLPRYHERYAHAVTFVRNEMELDLHQSVGHRALGVLVPTQELLDGRTPFEIAGTRVFALSAVDRLIHAAIHATTSHGSTKRLSSVADVLLLADKHRAEADAILNRADRWSVRSLVELAVTQCYSTAQVDVPLAWREAMRIPREHRDRLVDRAYLDGRRHPVKEEVAYLRLLAWSDRMRYIGGHLAGPTSDAAPTGSRVAAHARYLWSKVHATEGA